MRHLKEIRKAKGLTQQQMADLLCIERNSYTRYENDKRSISIDVLLKLADYFDTSVDYLLDRTDAPHVAADAKKDPSPEDRERAMQRAAAAVEGTPEPEPPMPTTVAELSGLIRQIVDQALEGHRPPTDNQS